jgi:protocatechuate 3,4-dioxygenase beta subunit
MSAGHATMRQTEVHMRQPLFGMTRPVSGLAFVFLLLGVLGLGIFAVAVSATIGQPVHEAPAAAPSHGSVVPPGEPGEPLRVSGVVVDASGTPIADTSLYVYQTDREGYYGVKPESDNRRPRLKLFLRTDADGRWAFTTIKPGSYPNGRVPAHIHFEVSAPERPARVFEIVFDGDPFITERMQQDPAFSVRPIVDGAVTERIVLR